jgi:uncharacterized membrane protein
MTKAEIKTFLDNFKLTATGKADDVGKTDIKREALAHYIKREGSEAFEMLGYKQESGSVASNYESNTVTDITGVTYNDITGKAETIELSEYIVNPKKTVFLEEAIKLKLSDQEEDMQNYEILTVYGFLRDSDNKCLATLETGCTVVLDNLGGQGFTHSDVNITLSGQKTYGTVDEIIAVPTFAEHNPA